MQEVNRQQVLESLDQVGVCPGDGLMVHAALQFLGRPVGGVEMYLEALQTAAGFPGGTLVVPSFNFGFARGEDHDPETAPAFGMGAFPEFFRQQPGVFRTAHPMQSFAVMGKHAAELAALDTPSAFDNGSAVDRMLDFDYKVVLLGADIQAVSALHYSEQRVGVPYRYWKNFSGKVKRSGEWQEVEYKMYVRDMGIDARLEIYEVADVLQARGLWQSADLNYGAVSLCRLRDFVAVTSELLAADPWRFVTNKPEEAA